MKGPRAVLFVNGVVDDYGFIKKTLREGDMVVCCDGGARHARALGIVPDAMVGDMDSLKDGPAEPYGKTEAKIMAYPADKDFTDLELGISYACESGAGEILIFGALGGRPDHAMANVHVLYQALQKKIPAAILSETCEIKMTDSRLAINGCEGETVSLIPMTGSVAGVVTEGLIYPLFGETLYSGYARGVSNRMTGSEATVSVSDGVLLVYHIKNF